MKTITVTKNALKKATSILIEEIDRGNYNPMIDLDADTYLVAEVSVFQDWKEQTLTLDDVSLTRSKEIADVCYDNISAIIFNKVKNAIDDINSEYAYKIQEAEYQKEFETIGGKYAHRHYI